MMLVATLTASLVTNSGRSAWFVGVLVLMVYMIFADALLAATWCPLIASDRRFVKPTRTPRELRLPASSRISRERVP